MCAWLKVSGTSNLGFFIQNADEDHGAYVTLRSYGTSPRLFSWIFDHREKKIKTEVSLKEPCSWLCELSSLGSDQVGTAAEREEGHWVRFGWP